MEQKQIHTERFLSAVASLLEDGKQTAIPVSGSSMVPFLAGGRDRVLLCAPGEALRKGQIALFRRSGGAFVLHRVCRVLADGSYEFAGDAQTRREGPVEHSQIVGVVGRVCRKGKWQGEDSLIWRFFAGPWRWLLPLRPLLFRLYAIRYRRKRRA